MDVPFGIWAIVMVLVVLSLGYGQLPDHGKGQTHSAWPGVVLVFLAMVAFLVLWLFVSGVVGG